MSKRRNRKSTQNIPQDILERARQQIAQDAAKSAEVETPVTAPEREQPYRARPRRREGLQPARLGEKQVNLSDPNTVQKMLANPTKVVTEDQLRQEYSYVLADLKNMGLLAAGLVVALLIVAQLL